MPAPSPESTVIKPLISAEAITDAVTHLAFDINAYYEGKGQLLVVGLLRGSFMFVADLARRLPGPAEIDFMTVSSYGNHMESSGSVKILKDLDTEIINRHVLLVEDIVDTGHTLKAVITLLNARKPASLKTCALLNKPSRREVDVKLDWVGFDIEDKFVVGYGIDYAQNNRNLPFIAEVVPD